MSELTTCKQTRDIKIATLKSEVYLVTVNKHSQEGVQEAWKQSSMHCRHLHLTEVCAI
jgi:hypothetical protein